MEQHELKPIVEAMIFVAEEPITRANLQKALESEGVERKELDACIEAIEKDWNEDETRGMLLAQVAGGYQFRTKEVCAQWLKRLIVPKPLRLSGPALETLAIVAYRQPIVRSEVEKIRGVDSGGVLKTLLERRVLRIVGRGDEPGQPLLYGTTKEFLEIFNLNTLRELPTLKDIEELARERRAMTESPEGGNGSERKAGDDEELTERLEDFDDEEEQTEVIQRKPLDEDVEEEEKDMNALASLEKSMKDLRRLEKKVFPKPLPQVNEVAAGGGNDGATETLPEGGEGVVETVVESDGAAEAPVIGSAATDGDPFPDASASDDRPVE